MAGSGQSCSPLPRARHYTTRRSSKATSNGTTKANPDQYHQPVHREPYRICQKDTRATDDARAPYGDPEQLQKNKGHPRKSHNHQAKLKQHTTKWLIVTKPKFGHPFLGANGGY